MEGHKMLRRLLLSIFTITLAACALTVELNKTFQLKYGATANVKDTPLKVTFQHVIDNRCVVDPGCENGGSAEVSLNVTNGDSVKVVSVSIPGTESASVKTQVDSYEFQRKIMLSM